MADVLQFPTQQSQGLAFLEREMRVLLESKGADEALIVFATQQLTQTYQTLSAGEKQLVKVALPEGLSAEQKAALEKEIDGALGVMHEQNHRRLLELVAQLVLAEVRLFQRERPESPAPD